MHVHTVMYLYYLLIYRISHATIVPLLPPRQAPRAGVLRARALCARVARDPRRHDVQRTAYKRTDLFL